METSEKPARKGIILSVLELFRLSKGKKIVDIPAEPLPPLLKRLGLLPKAVMPDGEGQDAFVLEQVRAAAGGKFRKKISRRVLRAITTHYGVKPRGFRSMPGRPNMLLVPVEA